MLKLIIIVLLVIDGEEIVGMIKYVLLFFFLI